MSFFTFSFDFNQPGRPAGCEEDDDHQEHLDDLFSTLVDLVSLGKLVERSGTSETFVESFWFMFCNFLFFLKEDSPAEVIFTIDKVNVGHQRKRRYKRN